MFLNKSICRFKDKHKHKSMIFFFFRSMSILDIFYLPFTVNVFQINLFSVNEVTFHDNL